MPVKIRPDGEAMGSSTVIAVQFRAETHVAGQQPTRPRWL